MEKRGISKIERFGQEAALIYRAKSALRETYGPDAEGQLARYVAVNVRNLMIEELVSTDELLADLKSVLDAKGLKAIINGTPYLQPDIIMELCDEFGCNSGTLYKDNGSELTPQYSIQYSTKSRLFAKNLNLIINEKNTAGGTFYNQSIAEATQMDPFVIAAWREGKLCPSGHELELLSKYLSVDPAALTTKTQKIIGLKKALLPDGTIQPDCFAKNFRVLMRSRFWSRQELAHFLQCGEEDIAALMNGRLVPTTEREIADMATKLKVDQKLLSGVPKRTSPQIQPGSFVSQTDSSPLSRDAWNREIFSASVRRLFTKKLRRNDMMATWVRAQIPSGSLAEAWGGFLDPEERTLLKIQRNIGAFTPDKDGAQTEADLLSEEELNKKKSALLLAAHSIEDKRTLSVFLLLCREAAAEGGPSLKACRDAQEQFLWEEGHL